MFTNVSHIMTKYRAQDETSFSQINDNLFILTDVVTVRLAVLLPPQNTMHHIKFDW